MAAMDIDEGKSSADNYELPWYVSLDTLSQTFSSTDPISIRVEKYRPIVLKDIVGNEDTVERLSTIAKDGNMPNIILSVSLKNLCIANMYPIY
jgi:hypothetical protein